MIDNLKNDKIDIDEVIKLYDDLSKMVKPSSGRLYSQLVRWLIELKDYRERAERAEDN